MGREGAFETRAHAPVLRPKPRDVLALLKPVTWFPPMWAFMCGVVSSGASLSDRWPFMVAGMLLAGPLVCGTSQAVNDWFDRHVDAINEPDRPIPSGRIAGRWGLIIAIIGSVISALVGAALGLWVFLATLLGLALAWAYSAPPFRLKMSGWWGPAAVGFSYEGLTWFTGAAVMLGTFPSPPVLIILILYSLGAHGIMTLNDFKAVSGDRQMSIRTFPLGSLWHAAAVAALAFGQIAAMPRMISNPEKFAPWYNGVGISQYVIGMLIAAFALGGLGGSI
jgi:chlorophyll/bacteriochlorophyll a synthase